MSEHEEKFNARPSLEHPAIMVYDFSKYLATVSLIAIGATITLPLTEPIYQQDRSIAAALLMLALISSILSSSFVVNICSEHPGKPNATGEQGASKELDIRKKMTAPMAMQWFSLFMLLTGVGYLFGSAIGLWQ